MKEILKLEQNSPAWFDFRKNKRNASETPIVMGLSKFKTKEEFAKEKLGLAKTEVSEFSKGIMEFGNRLEPLAREIASEFLNNEFKPLVYVSGEYLASLDGVCEETNIGIEIKCPYSPKSKTIQNAMNEQVDEMYFAQIQHQLMVSELDKITYCVFNFHNDAAKEFLTKYNQHGIIDMDLVGGFAYFIDVYADLEFQSNICKDWDKFMASLSTQDIQASQDDLSLAEQYEKLEQAKKQIEQRQQEIKTRLIVKAKSANVESLRIGNLTIKRNVGGGQFQLEHARQDLESLNFDVEKYCKPKFNWYSIGVDNE